MSFRPWQCKPLSKEIFLELLSAQISQNSRNFAVKSTTQEQKLKLSPDDIVPMIAQHRDFLIVLFWCQLQIQLRENSTVDMEFNKGWKTRKVLVWVRVISPISECLTG